MRRLALLLAGGAVWLLLAAVPVFADNGPHHSVAGGSPITDACSGCHRAHTGQAPNLLISSQTSLCYTCHGTTGTGATTDVQDGVQYSPVNTAQVGSTTRTPGSAIQGALRGGGFDNAAIDTSLTGAGSTGTNAGNIGVLYALNTTNIVYAPTTSRHAVDGTATAWGYGNISGTTNYGNTSFNLTCASCHDPHGNNHYRILKSTPDNAYTGAYAGPPPAGVMSNVDIADVSTYVYSTTNYWNPSDTNQTVAPTYIASISKWCASCHTRYLATAGAETLNSNDAVYTYRHRSDGTTVVTSGAAGQPSPTCVQCHVSHGSNAAMGANSARVPWPDGTQRLATDNSALLRLDSRGLCEKCHQK